MLRAENLSKYFFLRHRLLAGPGHHDHVIKAVDGVSLTVTPDKITGIIGESGSGKTTLVRTLLGLYQPTGGQAFYRDSDILSLDKQKYREFRREVQVISQDSDSTLDPKMTVQASLEEPLIINRLGSREERRAQVRRVMEQVNLAESFLERYPAELSGGQRQRIAIARVLLLKPRLIIADEPLAGLDRITSLQILKLLLDLKRESRLTYLLISHDLELINYACDRVAVMHQGHLVEMLEYEHPGISGQHPYTQKLFGLKPGEAEKCIDGSL